ncbi:MAG: hypothetical protein ABIC04_08310 [Nanoarchaeota archaeon]
MNKFAYILVFSILALALIANIYSPNYTGLVIGQYNTQYILTNLDEVKDEYNNNLDYVPGFIINIFGDETINLYIALNNGSVSNLIVKTEKGRIYSINKDESELPSLKVWTDEPTVDKIAATDDQVEAFSSALQNKSIFYLAITLETKIKTSCARAAYTVWSWFN